MLVPQIEAANNDIKWYAMGQKQRNMVFVRGNRNGKKLEQNMSKREWQLKEGLFTYFELDLTFIDSWYRVANINLTTYAIWLNVEALRLLGWQDHLQRADALI